MTLFGEIRDYDNNLLFSARLTKKQAGIVQSILREINELNKTKKIDTGGADE